MLEKQQQEMALYGWINKIENGDNNPVGTQRPEDVP